MLTFFEKEVNGYFFVFPIVSWPKTWLHDPWRVTLVWHLVTFYGPWLFPPPATRSEVTYRVWTGSVAWLGPSDCTENNLYRSDSGVGHKVKERVAVPCSHLFTPFPKSEPLEQASPKKTSRRHLVSTWLPVMARDTGRLHYFPPLTTQFAQILTLKLASFPALVTFCLPAAFDASIALFAFVFVVNSSGFESIFETSCTTSFPEHYKARLQLKPTVNDHLS